MRTWIATVLLTVGCATDTEPDDAGAGSANGSSTGTLSSTTAASGQTSGSGGSVSTSPSDFSAGGYLLSHLAIVAEHDVDADGTIDNNLPLVLNLVNVLLGSGAYSVEAVNEQIASTLYPDNILLVDASQTGASLTIDLLLGDDDGSGLTVNPESYDSEGNAYIGLAGSFSSQTTFAVAADMIELPIVIFEGADPAPLQLEQVTLSGNLDDAELAGLLYGVIPIQAVMDDMVEPLIPEEGVDMDGDGVNESKEELLELVWSIAPSAGDVDLGGGETGVSALLEFEASSSTF
jgi:hypothetical protein